jgi:hypothetical protein
MPMPAPALGVQRTGGDHRSAARQRAFEQALKKKPAAAVSPAPRTAAAGDQAAGVQVGGDGLMHVDVVV